jgi:hypothetical protein
MINTGLSHYTVDDTLSVGTIPQYNQETRCKLTCLSRFLPDTAASHEGNRMKLCPWMTI